MLPVPGIAGHGLHSTVHARRHEGDDGAFSKQKTIEMAIEIVDLPIKNCDSHSYVNVYQRVGFNGA